MSFRYCFTGISSSNMSSSYFRLERQREQYGRERRSAQSGTPSVTPDAKRLKLPFCRMLFPYPVAFLFHVILVKIKIVFTIPLTCKPGLSTLLFFSFQHYNLIYNQIKHLIPLSCIFSLLHSAVSNTSWKFFSSQTKNPSDICSVHSHIELKLLQKW